AGNAGIIGIFLAVYIRLSKRVAARKLIPGVLLFFSFSYLIFGIAAHYSHTWIYIPTFLWVYAAGAMCPAMGWTLANYALTTREARRVFGFIGAGPILGGSAAGFLTAAPGGSIPTDSMLLVLAVLQASAALPVRSLFRQIPYRMAELEDHMAGGPNSPDDFPQTCRLLLRSRYLLFITALVAVSCLCTTTLDIQFKMLAGEWYGSDKDAMRAFFGLFYGWMGLGSFLVQLVLTGRLLRSFGIRITLFILPAVFVLGTAGILLIPTLLVATLFRGGNNLLRYSLDKSSLELLYLPVAPDIKSRLKPFVDSFINRLADGFAGLVLGLFALGLNFGPRLMSLVNLVFIAGWFAVALAIRREYLNVLKRAIERRTLDPDRTTSVVLDRSTADAVASLLAGGDTGQILYGLSLFEVGREHAWHPYLRVLLGHPSPEVRRRALSLLCDGGDRDVVTQVEQMARDESPAVRGEALRYLVIHAGRDPVELLMQGRLDVPDHSIQGSVVLFLLQQGAKEHRAAAQWMLQQLIGSRDAGGAAARAAAARVLGMIRPPFPLHSALADLVRDKEPEVAEQAMVSAARIRGREFLPGILSNLSRPLLVTTAKKTLAQYGERVVGTLQDYLNDESVPLEVRRHIPAILARVPVAESAQVLTRSILQGNPGLRYDILKALNRLRRKAPALISRSDAYENLLDAELLGYHRSIQIQAVLKPQAGTGAEQDGESLLCRILAERMDYELERVFLLLALLYPQRDIQNAYHGIISRRPQLQANSLEVLEHLVKPDTYRILAPALDPEIPLGAKAVTANRICHASVRTKVDALRILLRSEDRWLKLCAVYEIGESCLAEFWEDVCRMAQDEDDPLMRETGSWTVERLSLESSI
ncbi:MAG: hypothetical protein FJW35_11740, partial [Acidobacteria bacterium]|nr:hypothetical protein [Acidobacteriota bacterium]